jgi:citrate lyase subunit beta/citryl-CoA lyase
VNVEKYVDKGTHERRRLHSTGLGRQRTGAEKEHARSLVEGAARRVRRCGADVVVRINRPLSMAVRDIEAAVGESVDGLAITKVESASHVHLLDELVSELEIQRDLPWGTRTS